MEKEKTITERFEEGEESLYAILGVAKDASAGEIKKAYYKLALRVHPDRQQADESEEAKERAKADFQTLGRIYETLSDEEKRKFYDETGSMEHDEFLSGSKDKNWEDYWRILFRKITAEDIESYSKAYKGTDLEAADVKKAYLDHEGDMESIMDHVVLSSWDDEARFRAILDPAIKAGELPKFPAYAKKLSKKQKAKQQQEAKEAEKAARKLGLHGDKSEDKLKQLITQNNARSESRFTSLISNLEAKYGGGKAAPRKGKRKSQEIEEEEPSEEAFLAARKRLDEKAKKGKGSGAKAAKGRKKQKVEEEEEANDEGEEENEQDGHDDEPTEEEFEQARRRLEERRKAASSSSEKKKPASGGRGGRGKARGRKAKK